MENREIIEKELDKQGYGLGCFDNKINGRSKEVLKKITDVLEFGSSDIEVAEKGEIYVGVV